MEPPTKMNPKNNIGLGALTVPCPWASEGLATPVITHYKRFFIEGWKQVEVDYVPCYVETGHVDAMLFTVHPNLKRNQSVWRCVGENPTHV